MSGMNLDTALGVIAIRDHQIESLQQELSSREVAWLEQLHDCEFVIEQLTNEANDSKEEREQAVSDYDTILRRLHDLEARIVDEAPKANWGEENGRVGLGAALEWLRETLAAYLAQPDSRNIPVVTAKPLKPAVRPATASPEYAGVQGVCPLAGYRWLRPGETLSDGCQYWDGRTWLPIRPSMRGSAYPKLHVIRLVDDGTLLGSLLDRRITTADRDLRQFANKEDPTLPTPGQATAELQQLLCAVHEQLS